mmetsp:Transcript_114734/g.365922  ORF Transcript_114734/g.365922 Transcript_114734/m.365922 type:complete len:232 (+) Transcript_114734:1606-2301(+)
MMLMRSPMACSQRGTPWRQCSLTGCPKAWTSPFRCLIETSDFRASPPAAPPPRRSPADRSLKMSTLSSPKDAPMVKLIPQCPASYWSECRLHQSPPSRYRFTSERTGSMLKTCVRRSTTSLKAGEDARRLSDPRQMCRLKGMPLSSHAGWNAISRRSRANSERSSCLHVSSGKKKALVPNVWRCVARTSSGTASRKWFRRAGSRMAASGLHGRASPQAAGATSSPPERWRT